jgi:site-specific DNA recombinase
MKTALIYARVSSDKQREEHTIASQTAALRVFAQEQGFSVPDEWAIEDEGYSGATLVRPGLERVRDLVAEGQVDAVLVHSPDRLSRKYAYQVLLLEEFARNNVQTMFVKAPQTATPEDQLLLQFQGMIAEYERAQILERSRRGKRHRALQGVVNVLCGAPYGYRYIRKTEHAPASYSIIDSEASVVRMVYELYTAKGLSIGAITRSLNAQAIPTRKQISRWERSTVWAMLRNPAYKGTACFNKTTTTPRQRVTRPLRMRGGPASRNSAHHERPRNEWIEIPVPAIITEEIFALAAERLQANKDQAPRRTITPSVVQGLVTCRKCGYSLYRTATRTSARKIYYYRCFGSDRWRQLTGPLCDSKPVRQEVLDEVVWREVLKLLESPRLIEEELQRRLATARNVGSGKRRQEILQRDLVRVQSSMERLMTAYQEDLLSLDGLRRRIPDVRKREQAIRTEPNAIENELADPETYLRLAQTVTGFLARLRVTAKTLDVSERQRIVRLLVKEIIVADDAIIIRHSIPGPSSTSPAGGQRASTSQARQLGEGSYLLRSGSNHSALRDAASTIGFQHDLQQVHHIIIIDSFRHFGQQSVVPDVVKIAPQIDIYDACLVLNDCLGHSVDRLMSCLLGSVSKRSRLEVGLEDRLQDELERPLHHPIPDGRN